VVPVQIAENHVEAWAVGDALHPLVDRNDGAWFPILKFGVQRRWMACANKRERPARGAGTRAGSQGQRYARPARFTSGTSHPHSRVIWKGCPADVRSFLANGPLPGAVNAPALIFLVAKVVPGDPGERPSRRFVRWRCDPQWRESDAIWEAELVVPRDSRAARWAAG